MADADTALAAAAQERAAIEARYVADAQACHPKFFATACIEQAKERRRKAISVLRPLEIEANTFKRQARVIERDKALAERIEKEEKERHERASRLETPGDGHSEVPAMVPEKGQGMLFNSRAEKHDAKVKQLREDEATSARKRAENIAAYERKKQEALERQQKVAARKAEKEQKRKAKLGEDAKPE